MSTPITVNLSINGNKQTISVADSTEPLLYVLRNQVGLRAPKYGCGVAQCGACTVHVNGAIARSCITRMNALAQGAEITTLESFAGCSAAPCSSASSPAATGAVSTLAFGMALRKAFVDQQAAQCGYCANAMIMGAAGWLQSRVSAGNTAAPTAAEIKAFFSGTSPGSTFVYLCRCGTHARIMRAIQQAAAEVL